MERLKYVACLSLPYPSGTGEGIKSAAGVGEQDGLSHSGSVAVGSDPVTSRQTQLFLLPQSGTGEPQALRVSLMPPGLSVQVRKINSCKWLRETSLATGNQRQLRSDISFEAGK